nr:aquaporin [Chthoniobacterales bacterium]
MAWQRILGSACASRAGDGAPPSRTFLTRGPFARSRSALKARLGKACFGEAPKPAREARAFPRLAVALFLLIPFSLQAAVEVTAIEMNVSDLARSREFYTETLQFRVIESDRASVHLRLGEESLILRRPEPIGRPIPHERPANDISFQHIAIVVSDIDAAYAQLQGHHAQIVSTGVQTLPDWNFDSARIRALYFRDPDGHFLELIHFPPNKGEPRWHRDGALFLGIDHSAVVVTEMKRSVAFYRDELGFTVIGNSFNYGGEQELLSGVPGARVRITSLRGAKGPGLELLQYEAPGVIQTLDETSSPNDLSHWQVDLLTTRHDLVGERSDPDGHAFAIEQRPSGAAQRDYALEALRQHWPRYLMEGAELGIFMIVALLLALVLEYPRSRLHKAIAAPLLRRFLFGLGIGITVVILIYCTWGRQSGAQFNPAVTLAMLYLHRIQPWDAFFYIVAQFLGGLLGVLLVAAPFWKASQHKKVKFVVTEPGKPGVAVAFAAEFVISFILFATLRLVYQSDALKPLLGYFAGLLLLVYITFESPLSGMSLNPARSVASAIPARSWKAMWIYFVAP